jgi:hypothetical protein
MSAATDLTVELEHPVRDQVRRPEEARRRWQCVCGQVYRVWGDRHRIYWPLDSPRDAPVVDGCCVRCRRPLPGKYAHCAQRS